MKKRRILVVGGIAAGPSAAAKASRTNPNAEVVLFESGETVSYGICEAPYAIAGLIPDERRLAAFTPERLREEKGFEAKTLHCVEEIQPSKHRIVVRDLRGRQLVDYEYDRLIVATGSQPRRLGIDGEDARNVFHLKSRDDTRGILSYLESESPSKAVIVGGGYIGMEMADALRSRGLDVTVIHRHRLPLAGLEAATREKIVEELQGNGIHFVTNARTQSLVCDSSGRVRHVATNRGAFESDLIILSLGVEPNTSLARAARIRLGTSGGILTDERQQTNIDGIYAAGDCCEVRNLVTNAPMYLPLATIASRAGWVAGENASGGRAVYKGAIRAIAVRIFKLDVAQVGLGSEEAREAGFHVATESISAYPRVGLIPGTEKLTIRLILDQKSQRVLGANVFGRDGAVLRANVLGVAIQHKLTVDDVARLDLIYAPPFAPLWDPVLVAANQAKKKWSSDD